jgi:hypothetical protein
MPDRSPRDPALTGSSLAGGLLLFLLGGAVSGCGGAACPATPIEDASQAIEARRGETARSETLRAEARVTQRGQEGRIRGTVLLLVERPDRVRFDATTQLVGAAAVLTSDGDVFALKDLRENRFLEGPACPENVARLLGIPLAGDEVARFLFGDTPLLPGAETRAPSCTREGTYLIEQRSPDGRRQEIELRVRDEDRAAPAQAQRLQLVRSERFEAGGSTEWRATFDDYRSVRDRRTGERVSLPMQIRFEHPALEADTRVKMKDVDLGIDIPEGAFRQPVPPGMAPEYVPCE